MHPWRLQGPSLRHSSSLLVFQGCLDDVWQASNGTKCAPRAAQASPDKVAPRTCDSPVTTRAQHVAGENLGGADAGAKNYSAWAHADPDDEQEQNWQADHQKVQHTERLLEAERRQLLQRKAEVEASLVRERQTMETQIIGHAKRKVQEERNALKVRSLCPAVHALYVPCV